MTTTKKKKATNNVQVNQIYGSNSIFSIDGTDIYCEFKVIALGVNILVEIFGTNRFRSCRQTVSFSQIEKEAFLLNEPNTVKTNDVVNVIKVEKQVTEVYISEYNQTWIDQLYNKYCSLLGRDRTEPKEYVISSIIVDDKNKTL